MSITGAGGRTLEHAWHGGAHAYLGMTVPGFGNMFCMYGPNTNLGTGSILYMIERQAGYLGKAAGALARHLGTVFDVRDAIENRFDTERQDRSASSAWAGCTSWYRQVHGRVPTNWQGTVSEYDSRTRSLRLGDYRAGAG